VGDATTIKVATNMVTAASVQAAAEALALISKSGLPVEKFAAAMRNNGSNSPTLDMKLPMMMEGNFEPHFSVKHMLKDVVIATRLARAFGMEFGATDASRHGLTEEMRQGRGDDDYSSLFRQYFPAGRSLLNEQQVSNGEDDQPRFAGLDEVKGAEQVADTPGAGSEAPAMAEARMEKEPTVVTLTPDETDEGALRVAAAQSMTTVAESEAQPIVSPPESPGKGEQSGDSRGAWGGFWRRRTDD
jgi:hypothetical protein